MNIFSWEFVVFDLFYFTKISEYSLSKKP